MVKVIRLYTGLGFSVEDVGATVNFEADVSGNWYLDGMLVQPESTIYKADKALLPGYVTFEAKVGDEFKKHTKWVEL